MTSMSMRRNKTPARLIAVSAALVADRVLGELPNPIHPVALFGKAMTRVEAFLWRDSVVAGGTYQGIGLAMVALTAPFLGSSAFATFCATYLCVAERSLLTGAFKVERALARNDLNLARELLRTLVGRDATELGKEDIARAAVESVAENSSDAVIAPMLYAAIFGPAGVLAYRAINTMDAMVGYKSDQFRRFGRFSAKVDDVANLIPARLSGCLAYAMPPRIKVSISAVLADASLHPSPNAGVIESVYAHKLGLVLGGENSYGGRKEVRHLMGSGRSPSSGDIARAARLCRRIDTLFGSILVGVAAGAFVMNARRR